MFNQRRLLYLLAQFGTAKPLLFFRNCRLGLFFRNKKDLFMATLSLKDLILSPSPICQIVLHLGDLLGEC